jgi:hypothetical protein
MTWSEGRAAKRAAIIPSKVACFHDVWLRRPFLPCVYIQQPSLTEVIESVSLLDDQKAIVVNSIPLYKEKDEYVHTQQ